jgi:hypothetical protein
MPRTLCWLLCQKRSFYFFIFQKKGAGVGSEVRLESVVIDTGWFLRDLSETAKKDVLREVLANLRGGQRAGH